MPGNVDNKQIYSLKVLIPFWVLELINVILLLAFGALELQFFLFFFSNDYCYYDDYYNAEECIPYTSDDTTPGLALAAGGGGLAIVLAFVFLILHITQIALFGRRKLTPAANFGFELPRWILLWILLAIQIAGAALQDYDYAVLTLTCTLWLLYLGTLIYACVLFHRSRRGRYNSNMQGYGAYSSAYGAPPLQQDAYQQGPYAPGPYQQPQYQQVPYQQQSQFQPVYQQQNQYPQNAPMQPHDMLQQSKDVSHSLVQPQPQMQQNHQIINSAPSDRSTGSPYQATTASSPPPHELTGRQ